MFTQAGFRAYAFVLHDPPLPESTSRQNGNAHPNRPISTKSVFDYDNSGLALVLELGVLV